MKYLTNLAIILNLAFLLSCAKPTVVNVVKTEDKNLNCKQLEVAVTDAQEFRQKALDVTGGTQGNYARAIFFWPALYITYANAHDAIVAANERSVHLINVMQDKNCNNLNDVLTQISGTPRVQTLAELSKAYKNLNDLYKSGALTEDEFIEQKKKILGQ